MRVLCLQEKGTATYSNLKVHHLLGEGAHLIVEAEPVFSRIVRGEHEIALSLLRSIHDDLVRRSDNRVVDIE
jgi:hypothetical protein